MKVAVLISGKGSNLRALTRAVQSKQCGISIVGVCSDQSHAEGLDFARSMEIPAHVLEIKKGGDRIAWEQSLTDVVAQWSPELVVLAGFMRVLRGPMLQRFPKRIVNVHPSLLPAFPGTHSAAQALKASVRITGCTVHIVDAGVDTGPILAQAAVPVLPGDDEGSLHERIQRMEHQLLPAVVHHIATGQIELDNPTRWRTDKNISLTALVVPPFFAPSAS